MLSGRISWPFQSSCHWFHPPAECLLHVHYRSAFFVSLDSPRFIYMTMSSNLVRCLKLFCFLPSLHGFEEIVGLLIVLPSMWFYCIACGHFFQNCVCAKNRGTMLWTRYFLFKFVLWSMSWPELFICMLNGEANWMCLNYAKRIKLQYQTLLWPLDTFFQSRAYILMEL